MKIQQKKIFLGWGSPGGQGGCERRIEFFVKIQKKIWRGGGVAGGGGGGGGGVRLGRVYVIEELKFLRKFTKKNRGGGGVGGSVRGGGGGFGLGGQGCE